MTEAYNMDCMEAMARMKDNEFDLAIVDPPYGIDITKSQRISVSRGMGGKSWDLEIPKMMYFEELERVSENRIIWGGNYFNLPPNRGFIIWDKNNYGRDFADCEYAFNSIDCVARIFKERPMNMDGGKVHPTQKPIKLYKWILKNYAKEGDRILDTHLGSGSSRIAAHDMGFDFVGYEIDNDYFEDQEKRFANHIRQQSLFNPKEMY
jgi:site-specific DNA-methyltransferase (adenine-specific)